MKKHLTLITTISITFLSLKHATTALAATFPLEGFYQPGMAVGSRGATLGGFLTPIIQNAPILAGLAAFFTALFAGFRFISASGNEKEVKSASQMLTYSIVGLALSILAFWITRILFRVGGAGGIF